LHKVTRRVLINCSLVYLYFHFARELEDKPLAGKEVKSTKGKKTRGKRKENVATKIKRNKTPTTSNSEKQNLHNL